MFSTTKPSSVQKLQDQLSLIHYNKAMEAQLISFNISMSKHVHKIQSQDTVNCAKWRRIHG